jgi:hypothetical protein
MKLGLSGAIPATPIPEAAAEAEPVVEPEAEAEATAKAKIEAKAEPAVVAPSRRHALANWNWRLTARVAEGAALLALLTILALHLLPKRVQPEPVVRLTIETTPSSR